MFACLVFDAVTSSDLSSRQPPAASRQIVAFAREWSPRVEAVRPGVVVLDVRGLGRLFGSTAAWAGRLAEATRTRQWRVRVAVADTRMAALLLAMGRPGVTVVPRGGEAAALAPLPLSLLATLDAWVGAEDDVALAPVHGSEATRGSGRGRGRRNAAAAVRLDTLARWGLQTLGDLAALPADEIAARLGAPGLRWHARARGHDPRPLVDVPAARQFEATLDLEWPIDGLEPLSFVLSRLLEPLCAELQHDERGAAVVHTRLDLVTRTSHARSLELPAPMADPKVLRTLILLDLEAHPPPAGIDRVHVQLDPMPARRVQFSLLRRPLPAPDQLATLMARLGALMGAGRCGGIALPDTHRPGAFTMTPFTPEDGHAPASRGRRRAAATPGPGPLAAVRHHGQPEAVLRRFRRPLRARVTLRDGRPSQLAAPGSNVVGGQIIECAGPWRTSGAWWRVEPRAPGGPAWGRDEWDVAIRRGPVCRISRRLADDQWVIEGVWD